MSQTRFDPRARIRDFSAALAAHEDLVNVVEDVRRIRAQVPGAVLVALVDEDTGNTDVADSTYLMAYAYDADLNLVADLPTASGHLHGDVPERLRAEDDATRRLTEALGADAVRGVVSVPAAVAADLESAEVAFLETVAFAAVRHPRFESYIVSPEMLREQASDWEFDAAAADVAREYQVDGEVADLDAAELEVVVDRVLDDAALERAFEPVITEVHRLVRDSVARTLAARYDRPHDATATDRGVLP